MDLDIAGRIRNVQVPISKPLTPLFEAISNSLDAIHDANENNGCIDIEIVRDDNNLFTNSNSTADKQLADITGFIIKDNGIGFDDYNFKEFKKSDTTNKASTGGKGIGRFTWLATFEKVEIESAYYKDNNLYKRNFTFCPYGSGIKTHEEKNVHLEKRETIVRLVNYKDKYKNNCPKRTDILAAYIIEEFLDVFIGPSCPEIILHDPFTDTDIDLNQYYDKEIMKDFSCEETEIKGKTFTILKVKLHSTHIQEHRIYFCAYNRVVTSEKLTGIPNLSTRLKDEEGRDFIYAVYINSNYLDEEVNPNRTGFNLSNTKCDLLPEELSLEEIRNVVRNISKKYLSPYTEPIKKQKEELIHHFVQEDGIMYRPIIKHLDKAYDDIDINATNDEIDMYLYEEYHKLQSKLRKQGNELMDVEFTVDTDFEEYEKRLNAYLEKVSEINKSDLARYVCHRKAIIEFIKKQLSKGDNNKYKLEEQVHNIVFPLSKTSDDISFESHNLWLVDERLAFHHFLSSDKPISQAKPIVNESKKEPDILCFNGYDKALAFSDNLDLPFSSITIIEFKKPDRNNYSEEENPFTQVTNYVDDIRKGHAKLPDGRAVRIPNGLPIYCYVVCDMTDNLITWAKRFDLQITPDGAGYYGYNRNFETYIEVISYSKMVADSEKRHKAFFTQLGLIKGQN
jgi:anti-sigma regulatory factor (Ser/Thr protein kinase)